MASERLLIYFEFEFLQTVHNLSNDLAPAVSGTDNEFPSLGGNLDEILYECLEMVQRRPLVSAFRMRDELSDVFQFFPFLQIWPQLNQQ